MGKNPKIKDKSISSVIKPQKRRYFYGTHCFVVVGI
jgi:hypothetical protein